MSKNVLYGVLPALTETGMVKVERIDCSEIDTEEGIYWPNRSGAGDEVIGNRRSAIQEALKQELRVVTNEIRYARKQIQELEKMSQALSAGLSDPEKIYLCEEGNYD